MTPIQSGDNLSEMDNTQKWESVWKWIAISATSAFFGLLLGQFTPNRNIVTEDQLSQHEVAEQAEFQVINQKLDTVNEYVGEQKGAEAARRALARDATRQR